MVHGPWYPLTLWLALGMLLLYNFVMHWPLKIQDGSVAPKLWNRQLTDVQFGRRSFPTWRVMVRVRFRAKVMALF